MNSAQSVALLRSLLDATSADQLTVPRSALEAVVASPPAAVDTRIEDLLTVYQAAARLGISVPHLYHLAKSLPFTVKIGKRQLRFDPVGLATWLAARPRHHGRAAQGLRSAFDVTTMVT